MISVKESSHCFMITLIILMHSPFPFSPSSQLYQHTLRFQSTQHSITSETTPRGGQKYSDSISHSFKARLLIRITMASHFPTSAALKSKEGTVVTVASQNFQL